MTMEIIIIASVFAYLVSVGAVQKKVYNRLTYENIWRMEASVVSALFWPAFLPLLIGNRISSINSPENVQAKRDREIEDANHRKDLAKIEADIIRTKEIGVGIR
jgi:hypothetical protein